MKGDNKMKVAFITYSKAPYRTKQFEHIVSTTGIELTVYYVGRSVISRKWEVNESPNFNEIHLKGIGKLGNHFLYYPKTKNIVKNYDLILLGGYNTTASYLFTYYAKVMKKHVAFVMDGISPDKIKESKNIKFYLKYFLLKQMDSFFANGSISKKYLVNNFSVNSKKIFNQFLTVDVNRIDEIYKKHSKNVKKNFQILNGNKFVVLYAGRLLERKRVKDIVAAISLLNIKNCIQFVIIGNGKEQDSIIKYCIERDVNYLHKDFVKKQDELFSLYNIADCLILPSENEPWGLVVNEATAAHLPVIVSDSCGCVNDLVKDNINGYIFQKGNIVDLSDKISMMYSNKNKIKEMGDKSFEIISEWKYENSARSFDAMLKELYKNGKN